MGQPINEDASVSIYTFDDPEGRDTFHHSTSHILAQAVQKLFPGTKLGIGPAIKDGFYYDFDSEHKFTPADLELIEKIKAELQRSKDQMEERKIVLIGY